MDLDLQTRIFIKHSNGSISTGSIGWEGFREHIQTCQIFDERYLENISDILNLKPFAGNTSMKVEFLCFATQNGGILLDYERKVAYCSSSFHSFMQLSCHDVVVGAILLRHKFLKQAGTKKDVIETIGKIMPLKLLNNAVDNNARLIRRGNCIDYEQASFDSAITGITGVDVMSLDHKAMENYEDDVIQGTKSFNDLNIQFQSWEIQTCPVRAEWVESSANTFLASGLLTQDEFNSWRDWASGLHEFELELHKMNQRNLTKWLNNNTGE
jgi:hypothetical protein